MKSYDGLKKAVTQQKDHEKRVEGYTYGAGLPPKEGFSLKDFQTSVPPAQLAPKAKPEGAKTMKPGRATPAQKAVGKDKNERVKAVTKAISETS
jgi:hypothetical protein